MSLSIACNSAIPRGVRSPQYSVLHEQQITKKVMRVKDHGTTLPEKKNTLLADPMQ